MVKLDKIYTRGGDTGLTSLGNGDRVKKDSLRVKSYGEVDEINAAQISKRKRLEALKS